MSIQPPTDDAPFTTGEFEHQGDHLQLSKGIAIESVARFFIRDADAQLCSAAFNAATSLHRSGYDAQRVFESLPEIMRQFTSEHYRPMAEDLRRKPKP